MSHPQPAAPPTVEHVLWTVVKDDRRAELRVRVHPLGQELRMLYDGGKGELSLLWSEVYKPGDGRRLGAITDEHQRAWCVRGWQVVEPARSDHPPA